MKPTLEKLCPFFLVSDVARSIAFYHEKLGFQTLHQQPPIDPFFAILGRDEVLLFIKSGRVTPQPNSTRDPEIRWDAYVLVNDPDALSADYLARGTHFSSPLADTHDGLRGFELTDPDGYVLFFGRPR